MSWFRFYIALLSSTIAAFATDAWSYGAFYVPEVPEGVVVEQLGAVFGAEKSQYFSGIIRVDGQTRDEVLLHSSSGLSFLYTMPGALTVERFEQAGGASSDGQMQSRLILHMTEGTLSGDSLALAENSQCVVETPLGRMRAGAGKWTLYISYDSRTRIYNFTLESLDVELSFITHSGERFVVTAGQMLTGAGASTLPDLEIADLLNSARDRIQLLDAQAENAGASVSMERLNAMLRPIEARRSSDVVDEAESRALQSLEGGKAIVIEYSPRPKPLIPVRGIVDSPSKHQQDLF